MKKNLLLSFIIFTTFNIKAQNNGNIELGLGGGGNLSFLTDSNNQNTSFRLSSNLFAVGEYYFSDRLGLRIKVIHDIKGYPDGSISQQTNNQTFVFNTDFKLSYLTIPITANFHFSRNRNWYTNIGLYSGFLLNAKGSELDLDVNDLYKKIDLGVSFGIGYKFNVTENIQLFTEYDAQIGLLKVFENNESDPVKNRRSSLNFGALLKL